MPHLFAYGHYLGLLPGGETAKPERARLAGYRPAFAARSTTDWGSGANPAPILALVPGGSCRGVAIEVAPEVFEETIARWREEQGADELVEAQAEIGLPFRRDPARVSTLTVAKAGPHALAKLPVERLARMALVARGLRGTGLDYLINLNDQLRHWGLEEPAVTELWNEVQKEREGGWR